MNQIETTLKKADNSTILWVLRNNRLLIQVLKENKFKRN